MPEAENHISTPAHPDAPLFKALHQRELLKARQETAEGLTDDEMSALAVRSVENYAVNAAA